MIKIIGAGMAGLLAARMLYRHDPIIYEQQTSLPNNHSAVLRFRTPAVGEILGIPFRKVKVLKSTWMWHGPVASVLAYTDKVTGTYRTDRSIDTRTELVDRWIAPPDLIQRMAEGVKVEYGIDYPIGRSPGEKVISTMPMPALMEALDYPFHPLFSHIVGTNLVATIDRCDAYASTYVPDPDIKFSRVSITGNQMVVEFPVSPSSLDYDNQKVSMARACNIMGVDVERIIKGRWEVKSQRYAKILPINEDDRKSFIYWASTIKGIAYSLGRFACWRPGLLLDDVVKDVRYIEKMMDNPRSYYDQQQKEIYRR